MYGPTILANFLEIPSEPDDHGNRWQYNSRSDRHSKIGCWGIAFDLLANSALLRAHAAERRVVLGVNHSMTDFQTHRKKKLDLVIARPSSVVPSSGPSLRSLVKNYRIRLSGPMDDLLYSLPDIAIAEVGAVLVALEAKAAMTAHQKARPRLYDELNSSHLCVHGASEQALAIGYVQINAADEFVSSVSNPFPLSTVPARVTKHDQPKAVEQVLEKVSELPRRTGRTGVGFDAIGVSVLKFENRGGPVELVTDRPAPQHGDPFEYAGMIVRMANEYDTRFHVS